MIYRRTAKKKMRTSLDVFNRVRFDVQYDRDLFTIGYTDRFIGIIETSFNEFAIATEDPTAESFIPWHRVVYFKNDGEIVWDRRTKTDKVFDSVYFGRLAPLAS